MRKTMTVKEFYEQISGNYEDAVSRLLSDDLIRRFALKYLEDPSFDQLKNALIQEKAEESFKAAHTLKGVSKTLAFEWLGDHASRITEMLRKGDLEQAVIYFPILEEEHKRVRTALEQLEK